MPCPCCGEGPSSTTWKADPLRWELDPPCTESEWRFLAELAGAPTHLAEGTYALHASSICRGCYNNRSVVKQKLLDRRKGSPGGVTELGPTKSEREAEELLQESRVCAGRPARIDGLVSAAGAGLNGQCCRVVRRDSEIGRWLVELLDGEQKYVREENLTSSKELDTEYCEARSRLPPPPRNQDNQDKDVPRPLGSKTPWAKVKGIHPGAVVRLRGLQGGPQLNGRKGRCLTFDQERGRWKIDLGDEHKAIRPENLEPALGEKPPTRESAACERKSIEEQMVADAERGPKEKFAASYGWAG